MESAIETEPKGVWRWSQPLDIAHAREFHAEALEVLTPERTGQLLLDLRDSV
jgi:hypothetical protein